MLPFRNSPSAAAAALVLASLAAVPGASAQELFDPLADAREFDPVLLREWSRNTIRIMETYQDYKESFARQRPKRYDSLSRSLVDKQDSWSFYLEWDLMSPVLKNGSAYSRLQARTDKGSLEVDLQKSYGAAQAGYLARDWEAGAYAIADWLDLRADGKANGWHAELFRESGDGEEILFRAGKTLIAGYGRWRDWTLDAGALIKYAPLTASDSAGEPIFRLRQRDDSTYTGEEAAYGVFLDAGKAGYSVNTLVSLEDKVESLGFRMPDFGAAGFTVSPFLRYQAYRSRFQAGAEASRRIFPIQDLYLEAAGDLHRNSAGRFEAFHHEVLGQTLILFGLSPERLASYRRFDFRILLDADISLSSDALDGTVWGYAGAITLQDMGGVATFRLGMGYNDWRYLRLFPERGAVGFNLLVRAAW